jgi:septal ring-binding cell division protein DamX
VYAIQVASTKSYSDPENIKKNLKLNTDVWFFQNDGFYKYVTGKYPTEEEAKEAKLKLAISGFIVAVDLSMLKEKPIEKVVVPVEKVAVINDNGKIYTIQLTSIKSYTDPITIKKRFNLNQDVWYFEKDGIYKYVTGKYATKEDAKAAMTHLGVTGFVIEAEQNNKVQVPVGKAIVPDGNVSLPNEKAIIYSIQLTSMKAYADPVSIKKRFNLSDEVFYFQKDGQYKYVTGKYPTKDAAKSAMSNKSISGFVIEVDQSILKN